MTTIVLADDHPIVRRGLRTLLETERGLQIVGEAGDGLEAVHLVESLQPDVLIVDVLMPGLSGLEVARQVSRRCSFHPVRLWVVLWAASVLCFDIFGATAQQRQVRLGVLTSGETYNQALVGLREGLTQLGYREGHNLTVMIEDAAGAVSGLTARFVE
jgi:CheY-like chemotaxis protein